MATNGRPAASVDPNVALAYKFPEVSFAYDERDVALYALGVGACGADAVDDKELHLVHHRDGKRHIKGGGWCSTVEACSKHTKSALGSSNFMEAVQLAGIFSNEQSQNSADLAYQLDFYNWNKVFVRYCDGASFSGDAEYEDQDGNMLFFGGLRIWEAVIDEIMESGLAKAKQVTFFQQGTLPCVSDDGRFIMETPYKG